MFVEVKDPDEKVILSRQYGSEGRITFTSHTPGEHQICLHSNSCKFALFADRMLRVHLDIKVGEHTNNYAEIAAKDKLTEMQLRVIQLMEQVDQIRKEQNYQRYCEERFRQTNESTNLRILWWSIFQALILVAFGFLQTRHLNDWKKCTDIGDVHLPTGYYFGPCATTGDLSDKADDPMGNFRNTLLTGWKVFPVFELCQSLWGGSLTKPPHHYRVAVISQGKI
ncbi:transmembrane emp24 domain-containing protein 9-like [Paramisgurnus dabryanus]|uniref:transmembrane emp24 domain-containing protein 9-like n=1 Tax=Paramisgurnus dabryanus TaxID=90735 RepID=UPI0031F3E1BE